MMSKLVWEVDGQSLSEYALIMTLIALTVIAALLGGASAIIQGFYDAVNQVWSS